MARLISEVQANRDLVRDFYLNEDGSPRNPSDEKLINDVYDSMYHVSDVLGGPSGRFKILETVKEFCWYLALWKAFKAANDWEYFLADLRIRAVPERDIAAIKRLVETEFSLIFSELSEVGNDGRLVIQRVKSFNARNTREGIVLEIELLED